MTHEEAIKTLQLQKEIESILESKMHQESGSSEDSGDYHSPQYNSYNSPQAREHLKVEKKYQKKIERVFDTLAERVENQSSSGQNSGDEKSKCSSQLNQKKRKYQEF